MRGTLKKMFDIVSIVYENVHLFAIFARSNNKTIKRLKTFSSLRRPGFTSAAQQKCKMQNPAMTIFFQTQVKKACDLLAIN